MKNTYRIVMSIVLAVLSPYMVGAIPQSGLTPIGAEQAGNKEQTIPEYSYERVKFPKWVYKEKAPHIPNPYKHERPLFNITADNYLDHADKLTAGQVAMFERYPETFVMPIYKTHRNASYPAEWYLNSDEHLKTARLVDDGEGFEGAFYGVPFPQPKNGYEMIWNHKVKFGAHNINMVYDGAVVYNKGHIGITKALTLSQSDYLYLDGGAENVTGIFGKRVMEWKEPKKRRGEMILVHEPMNQIALQRSAWTYMPATRRVRRAPVVAYDTPSQAGMIMTTDDGRLFNGALDRYDWNIIGKQEVYIPYNNYLLDDPTVTYKQLLTRNHINPIYMRYELHRVWVLEATLKPKANHVYAKRRFYLDEDSWSIQLADIYDGRGNLWRTHMQSMIYHPKLKGPWGRVQMFHDLHSGHYVLANLINEQKEGENLNNSREPNETFTPSGLLMRARQ